MKPWCPYCKKDTHDEDCPIRKNEERNRQDFENFIIGFRCLFNDTVEMDGDRWKIAIRSGSTVIRLTVDSVSYA